MTTLSLFDQADEAKRRGIELVYQHADTHWKREAAYKLYEVIQTRTKFTSDDILMPLEAAGIVTKDNRAIAAILKSAERMKLITATDEFVRCRRPSRHGAPIMQWRSNIAKQPS